MSAKLTRSINPCPFCGGHTWFCYAVETWFCYAVELEWAWLRPWLKPLVDFRQPIRWQVDDCETCCAVLS